MSFSFTILIKTNHFDYLHYIIFQSTLHYVIKLFCASMLFIKLRFIDIVLLSIIKDRYERSNQVIPKWTSFQFYLSRKYYDSFNVNCNISPKALTFNLFSFCHIRIFLDINYWFAKCLIAYQHTSKCWALKQLYNALL